jgi:3-oxoacyl-[acyl-carrier protein] reductase
MKSTPLAGQIALITGANRGIGKALATAIASAGATTIITARNPDTLESLEDAISAQGGTSESFQLDVTNSAQVKNVISSVVKKYGRLDLLINNAGIDTNPCLPWEQDPDEWWQVQEVNVRGAYLCSHAALGYMTQQGSGRIIDIGSLIGATPNPLSSAYAVSKTSLLRLSSCLAAAAKDFGVSIFTVSPGLVATDMTNQPKFSDIPKEQWTPIEKCEAVVLALAAGKADKLTGRFIHAGRHDLEDLIANANQIIEDDMLTLGISLD